MMRIHLTPEAALHLTLVPAVGEMAAVGEMGEMAAMEEMAAITALMVVRLGSQCLTRPEVVISERSHNTIKRMAMRARGQNGTMARSVGTWEAAGSSVAV